MSFPEIYADFQKTDDSGRLILTTIGTKNDLKKYNLELQEGMLLTLYNEDESENRMLVSGRVVKDCDKNRWLAEVVWDNLIHCNE